MIPRDPCSWYCHHGQHSQYALKATCACCVCYPTQLRSSACTLCQGVCSCVCFARARDPHAQFEEGKVAIETVDRFLTQ
jgi:hypothetical protein